MKKKNKFNEQCALITNPIQKQTSDRNISVLNNKIRSQNNEA